MIYTKHKIIYVNFNYSKEYIILGLVDGYEIYKIDPFQLKIKKKLNKSIGIIDILENTNIIIFSGNDSNQYYCNHNNIVLYDDNKNKEIIKISCESNILNLKITPKYIIAVLIDKVVIYNHNLCVINYINTGNNIHGIISIYYDDNIMKYGLIGNDKGNIILGNDNLFSKKILQVHKNIVNNICFNKSGDLIATTSIIGTIIRIYNVNNNKLIKELRRGSSVTRILNISFNDISNILVCSSIKGSIHVFNTGLNNELNKIENKKIKYLSKIFNNLPINSLSSYINSEWSFTNYQNNILFLQILFHNNFIYAISNNGKFYKIKINNNGQIEIINILFLMDEQFSPFNIKNN